MTSVWGNISITISKSDPFIAWLSADKKADIFKVICELDLPFDMDKVQSSENTYNQNTGHSQFCFL